MSATIGTTVQTAHGAKYVLQLCKHWAHKLPVELDRETGPELTGIVTFPTTVATLAATAEGIAITIAGEAREDVERMTGVVADHLDRFAFREAPISYDWAWGEAGD